jgi:hypothetical protein
MRRLATVLAALSLGACTSVVADKDADGGGYALTVPSDVFASRPMLWKYAAEKSGDLCPFGWTLAGADNDSADVHWKIRCMARPAFVTNQ